LFLQAPNRYGVFLCTVQFSTMKMSASLVMLFHGVAAFGHDLAPLARVLKRALPDAIVVSPDAPFACDQGTGRQWYSLDGVTAGNRLCRVEEARPACDALFEEVVAAHGFGDRPDRVALVGFSQGATMVFDGYASGRWRVGAVALLSGRFPVPSPFAPAEDTPVLLVHGADDPAVPPAESEQAFAVLTARGVCVAKHILPRIGHTVSPKAARLTAKFLQEALSRGNSVI
jgi:phospholipase/carboxylesterase